MSLTKIPTVLLQSASVLKPMASVATRSELAQLATGSVAYLSEGYSVSKAGRSGVFVWRDGDFSALAALDPFQGVCVPHATVPVTAGAFIRDHDKGECHAEWWGIRSVYDSTLSALVQDDSARLNSALAYVGIDTSAVGTHFQYERGGELKLPRGYVYVTDQIWIPNGVYIEGNGTQSSGIVGNWPNSVDKGIWIGSKDQTASFSCGLRNLSVKDVQPRNEVARNTNVVYTESAQHTGGVDNVLIYSGGRTCFRATGGYGGATYLTVRNLETCNFGASLLPAGVAANPQVVFDYSSAMIYAENLVTQGSSSSEYAGGETSKGCVVASGYVTIRNFHVESVAYGVECNLKTQYGHLRIEGATGGASDNIAVVSCQGDALSNATIQLENIRKNSSQYTYRDFRSGKTSYAGDIIGAISP